MKVFGTCISFQIRLEPDWVPWKENELADFILLAILLIMMSIFMNVPIQLIDLLITTIHTFQDLISFCLPWGRGCGYIYCGLEWWGGCDMQRCLMLLEHW